MSGIANSEALFACEIKFKSLGSLLEKNVVYMCMCCYVCVFGCKLQSCRNFPCGITEQFTEWASRECSSHHMDNTNSLH